MNKYLNNNLQVSDIALTYYDKDDEVIKELDDNFYCTLSPFSNSFYTLYLVGDLMYTNNVKLSFSITSKDTTNLDIRAYQGEFNYNLFDDNTDTVTVNYNSSTYRYTNALPVNIRISCNDIIQSTAILKVILEVLD